MNEIYKKNQLFTTDNSTQLTNKIVFLIIKAKRNDLFFIMKNLLMRFI